MSARRNKKEEYVTSVVDREAVEATDTDLTPRMGLVFGAIVHRGNVDQLDLIARLRRADSAAGGWVIREDASAGRAVFGHGIAVRYESARSID